MFVCKHEVNIMKRIEWNITQLILVCSDGWKEAKLFLEIGWPY